MVIALACNLVIKYMLVLVACKEHKMSRAWHSGAVRHGHSVVNKGGRVHVW